MKEIIKKSYLEDINNINTFLSSRPDTLGVYCYRIGHKFNKKFYKLFIVTDDIWQWQKDNPYKEEFSMYVNHLSAMECEYVNYLGVKGDDYLVDYILINKDSFLNSLSRWQNFSIASCFQKPFIPIKSNEELDNSIQRNQRMALLLSLMMIRGNKTHFFNVMEKLYSLSSNDFNDNLDAIDQDYRLLEYIYGNNSYFHKQSNGQIIINKDLSNNDVCYLPTEVLQSIEQTSYGLEFSTLYDFLQDKMFKEQQQFQEIQIIINGFLKSTLYDYSRGNKCKLKVN